MPSTVRYGRAGPDALASDPAVEQVVELRREVLDLASLFDEQIPHHFVIWTDRNHAGGVVNDEKQVSNLVGACRVEVVAQIRV